MKKLPAALAWAVSTRPVWAAYKTVTFDDARRRVSADAVAHATQDARSALTTLARNAK